MKKPLDEDDPGGVAPGSNAKAIKISSDLDGLGMSLKIERDGCAEGVFKVEFPADVWRSFPRGNKQNLMNDLAYAFTAHFPLRYREVSELKYSGAHPRVFDILQHTFLKHAPTYSYLHKGREGMDTASIVKSLVNADIVFEDSCEFENDFYESREEAVIIPLTFGKDSLLTYCLAEELGLDSELVYFNEPTEVEIKPHRFKVTEQFQKDSGRNLNFIENDLAALRDMGAGWFGWEATLISYLLLSLPFAHSHRARYLIFSNEISCEDYFYGAEGTKVMFDYVQSREALRCMSQYGKSATGDRLSCTTLLSGIYEIAVLAVLKQRYRENLKYLTSCWDGGAKSRWCGKCSKCARIYLFLVALGVDPFEAGFEKNMLGGDCRELYSVFEGKAGGAVTFDSLGLNKDEQLFAFYLAYLRESRDELVVEFSKSSLREEAHQRFEELTNRYLCIHPENFMPRQWKKRVDGIFTQALGAEIKEIIKLIKNAKVENRVLV